MARRGENIRKRKDGRWEGRYTRKDEAGINRVHSVYASSYMEVKDKLAFAKSMLPAGLEGDADTGGNILFNKAAEDWLQMTGIIKKYSTFVKYRSIYNKYLSEPLQDIYLQQINTELVNKRIFQDNQYSDSIQRSIYSVLKQILCYGAATYQIPQISLQKQAGTGTRQSVEILDPAEQERLLQFLYRDMDVYKMGIVVCISAGLRLGEICSLKWEDIDFTEKIMRVNRTVQRIAMEGKRTRTVLYESEPKSICSKREIPLSDAILQLFSAFRHNGVYVLGSRKPLEPRTYQYKFQSYLKSSNVGHKNFHALRHTFATNCMNSGVDAKSLSELLGHSSVQITLDRYVHPSLDVKRRYMDTVASIYGQYTDRML